MKSKCNLIWEPMRRLGEIEFGAPLGEATSTYHLARLPEEERDTVGWEVYGDRDETLRVYLEDGKVTSVACYRSCILNGKDLIGMEVIEACAWMGYDPVGPDDVVEMPDGPQDVYEFVPLEAQIWAKEGCVVTVFCDPPGDD
ncbi:MAG: hypothetical protein KAI66_22500 [Lentisphaeria bacterium]|nr:hypothetical protein [Lentisphaeria bacterium]